MGVVVIVGYFGILGRGFGVGRGGGVKIMYVGSC